MKLSARSLPVAALVFLLVGGVVGGMLGDRVLADASQRPEDQIWTFAELFSLVQDEYVGTFDSERFVEGAIDGLLGSLDPHSNYLDPESFGEMRDEQRGRFYGLGIQITKRGADKPLTIIAPIDDTPASRAGLMSGDIISHIEGEPTIELTVQDAVRLLKGARGTRVSITIRRPGRKEPFDVTIERDEIPIQSVRASYMVDGSVGVVRMSTFNGTSSEELDAAVAKLQARGMTKLILDLRGNPGGLLDQAVQVSERFVGGGRKIVETRGRIRGADQEFVSRADARYGELPLIVLVDDSSASASEIVSGAIQDHDRGLVVGETTFGKGLVQRVIPLDNGGALAVTTAKYYTPAGRLIQRDFSDLDDYYLNRGVDDEDGDSLVGTNEVPPLQPPEEVDDETLPREVFYTAGGREVFGGGGIRPDHIVKAREYPDVLLDLVRQNLIFDYAVNTVAELGDEQAATLVIDDAQLADFAAFLAEREFEYDPAAFAEHREMVVVRLRSQLTRLTADIDAESAVLAGADPQIQRALEVFDEAERLARERIERGDADAKKKKRRRGA